MVQLQNYLKHTYISWFDFWFKLRLFRENFKDVVFESLDTIISVWYGPSSIVACNVYNGVLSIIITNT